MAAGTASTADLDLRKIALLQRQYGELMAMRRKTTASTPDEGPLQLTMSRAEARQNLEGRIEIGREFLSRNIGTKADFENTQADYYKWDSFNDLLLKQMFTNGSLAQEYSFWGSIGYADSLSQQIRDLEESITQKIRRLDSIIERLQIIPLQSPSVPSHATAIPPADTKRSNKVFIVHGHDDVSKTNLEVFVRENGLEPIVLHRQADEGMTIIEKFEKHSDVGYAFILLTPDEIAYLTREDELPDSDRRKEYRARPNVLFEFGYFVGKLGRSRVCCLHTGGVALPSDVSGMIYKAYNKSIDEVAYAITKDLKAAGYTLT